MADFRVAVRHLDGAASVQLVGVLDLAALPDLEAGLRPLLHRYDAAQIELDCAALQAVDGHGLHALLQVLDRFGPSGRPCLRSPSPTLRQLLALARAEERFELSS